MAIAITNPNSSKAYVFAEKAEDLTVTGLSTSSNVTIAVYLTCDIHIVQGMCALLARGAIISEIVIMVFLAPQLCIFEGLIAKTTRNWRLQKEGEYVVS